VNRTNYNKLVILHNYLKIKKFILKKLNKELKTPKQNLSKTLKQILSYKLHQNRIENNLLKLFIIINKKIFQK